MAKFIKNALLYLILPLLVIFIVSWFSHALSIILIAAYILCGLYRLRGTIYTIIGNWTYSKGNIDNAIRWFKKAYNIKNRKPNTVVSYAYLLLKSGDTEESEKILTSLINTNIGNDNKMLAKSNLALVLWKKDRLDDAIAMLEEVLESYKTSTVYGSLGYLYIAKGDLDKALAFNQEAYEYNSYNKIILDNLGQTYYLRGEYDKAEEIYDKLMLTNPTFPEAYYNHALLLDKTGKTEKAVESLNKALTFKTTFLSTVTGEEIEEKIKDLSAK